MLGLLHAIVQNWVSGSLQCRNIVSSDGITTRNFTINRLPGICVGTSIDAELSRRNINSLGNALGIAKNLDEYQLKICLKIPCLPDSDPTKIHLQKFRIGIIASFAILVATLHSEEPENGYKTGRQRFRRDFQIFPSPHRRCLCSSEGAIFILTSPKLLLLNCLSYLSLPALLGQGSLMLVSAELSVRGSQII